MKIHITEHKSKGTLNPVQTAVRVFIDNDYHYGYLVDEHKLYDLLTPAQRQLYLQGSDVTLDVEPAVAQQLIDIGVTPYKKPRVHPAAA